MIPVSVLPADIGNDGRGVSALDCRVRLTSDDTITLLKRNIAASDRQRNALIRRAETAERAERQIALERDRWKLLALKYEAQLRSMAPERRQ